MSETKELPSEPGKVTGQFPPRVWLNVDYCPFYFFLCSQHEPGVKPVPYVPEAQLAIERERSKRLAEALEFIATDSHEDSEGMIRPTLNASFAREALEAYRKEEK